MVTHTAAPHTGTPDPQPSEGNHKVETHCSGNAGTQLAMHAFKSAKAGSEPSTSTNKISFQDIYYTACVHSPHNFSRLGT